MKKIIILLFISTIFIGCDYKKNVTVRFNGNNSYTIDKWVWYRGDAICMSWYDLKTNNIDSAIIYAKKDCDNIIKEHKKIIKNTQ